MAREDGGAAFPNAGMANLPNGDIIWPEGGMSLRDYFAAAALTGIEASQGNGGEFIGSVEKIADRAYRLADAMIAERSK